MLDDEGLTEQERLFCLYYVKYFRGKQAVRKVGYVKRSTHSTSSRLFRRECIAFQVQELKAEMAEYIFGELMNVLNE
ncbi:terminase small subunit [Bacillus anthracis]|uniref:terminase small subunit n=1 Tax=Bacillus TaxID=1386 RepID=UPI00077B1819|nr:MULTISPECIES: terminase small subunit [Bacillus cereus group]PEU79008.1 terminase small subunit [Bacillus anthracis]KXY12796.1 terminase [Bacillus cereus]MDE7553323.1 terminase small subunit [Bacillus tropicus]MDE7571182.1 terminase small subunit [Bacillus tropicus]PEF44259.1 terminase small subunit [Bacillus cereus]